MNTYNLFLGSLVLIVSCGITPLVSTDGTVTFSNADVCASCISIVDIAYGSNIPSYLSIFLANGDKVNVGSLTSGSQLVAVTQNDTQAPVMSSIIVSTERNNTIEEKILVGNSAFPFDILYIEVGQIVTINVTIEAETAVMFGVDYGDSISVANDCDGPITAYQFNHTYISTGSYLLQVNAATTTSNTNSQLQIIVVYPIESVTATDNGLSETIEPETVVNIDVVLSGSPQLPFGNASLVTNCGPSVILVEEFTLTSAGTQTVSCNITAPGDYTVVVSIVGPLDNIELYRKGFIAWDNLTFDLVPSSVAFAIGSNPSFEFIRPPKYNFDYVIDFGEGTILNASGPTHLQTCFSGIDLPFLSYTVPGNYSVTLTGSNPGSNRDITIYLLFEYGIPPFHLEHAVSEPLLAPPGNAEIFLYADSGQAEPVPTDVSCTYNYGDGDTEAVPNVMLNFDSSGVGLTVQHVYTTEDVMNITIGCENRVSSRSASTTIDCKVMNVSIIEIVHEDILPMNNSEPVQMSISYSILDFTTPPPNLTHAIAWNESQQLNYYEMSALADSHVYSERGSYRIEIIFEYYGVSRSEVKQVIVGGVDFYLTSDRIAQTNTTSVTFNVVRYLQSDANYVIKWGDSSPDTEETFTAASNPPPIVPTGTITMATHVFIHPGTYIPIITYTSTRGTEYLHLNESIFVENKIQDLQIVTEERYTFSDAIIPIINMNSSSLPVKNISCYFNYTDNGISVRGDLIDETSSIQTLIQYSDLGEKVLIVTCSNQLSEQLLQAEYLVFSVCFDSSSLFEKAYAKPTTPLKLYTTYPQTITGRASLTDICKNRTSLQYTWNIKLLNGSTVQTISTIQPNSISLLILNYLSEPGLYRLELALSFPEYPDDYISDHMHIELVDPPLVAKIDKGSERSVSIGIPIEFDAQSKSYDPKTGFGKTDSMLKFSWKCYTILDNSTVYRYSMPFSEDMSYKTLPECAFTLPPQGLITNIDTSIALPNTWSIIELEVRKGVRRAIDIQVLYLNSMDAPLVGISCKYNCQQKVLYDDITYFESSITCPSCEPYQLDNAEYLWTIYNYNFVTESDDRLPWGDQNKTARTDKDFLVSAGMFEEGKSYMVELEVTLPGKDMGQTTTRINVNQKPYGGSCSLNPINGWSTVTRYQVTCDNWKDESFRSSRDVGIDTGEPVTYRIEQISKLGSFVVYEGGEKSTPPIHLQACENCNLVIRIFDFLKSEDNITQPIHVESPLQYYFSKAVNESNGTVVSQTDILEAFFDRIYTDINVTLGYDSLPISLMTCASYASVINQLPLEPSPISDLRLIQSNDSLDASQTILDAVRIVDPQLKKVTEALEFVITTIASEIKKADSKNDLSVANVLLCATSLSSAIDSPQVISSKAQLAILKSAVTLSNALDRKLSERVVLKDTINTMEAIFRLQDKIIDIGGPDMAGFRPDGADYTVNDIEQYQADGLNPVEKEELTKIINRRKRFEVERFVKNAGETIAACHTLWDNAFKIMERATADNTNYKADNKNFVMELTKGTVAQIVNLQESKTDLALSDSGTGVTFDFENIETDDRKKGSTSMKTVLLNKNIYTNGPNSPIYDSGVVIAEAEKGNIPALPIVKPRVGYPNAITGFIYVESPKFIPEDASFMFYWRFVYRHQYEHVCCSLRPTRDDIKYDIFWRSKIPPSDFEYDVAFLKTDLDDWKVQIDGCLKPGQLKRLGAGFIGLRPYLIDPVSRRKRSVTNQTQSGVGGNANSSDPLESPYYIRLMSFSCASWNGVKMDWDPGNCELEYDLLKNVVSCLCQSDTNQVITASSFFVPPNSIDFSTVFSKFDIQSQAAVLGTILTITVIAILACVWGHWKDRHDKLQWGVTLLEDNYKDDGYFYLITVYTGLVRSGGTKSKIHFNLSGERGDTGVRSLSDGVRKEFASGSVMHFLMSVPRELGLLQCFRVWHDNSGKGKHASWYLNRIEIHDIQTNDRYDFMCSDWLSVEDDYVEKMLHVSGTVNFNNFKTMFYEHATSHVTDDHLWLSVFLRPVKSHFYRTQRIGCCYALLMLTMIANAMFFQGKDQKDRQQLSQVELGPIRFSLNQLYISFVSIIITSIPLFLIILLFRKSKLNLKERKKRREAPDWLPKFVKEHIEYSNKLEEALVIRDISDDKEGVLPHFCIYIAWVTIFISAFVSAFFLMLYSIEWGKSLSEEWLTSFFLSFFQSIAVVDPFKVIFLAVVFALFLKAIKSSKPTSYNLKEVTLLANEKGLPNAGRRKLKFSSPYSDEHFLKMKARMEKNNLLHKILKELVVNLVFLWLLLSLSYSNRDTSSFLLNEYVENNFIRAMIGGPPHGKTYNHIIQKADFFEWVNETVLPTLFKENDYRDIRMVSLQRLFSYDTNNLRVGPPRLRQVRVKDEECDYPYLGKTRCLPGYWLDEEDQTDYCIGWTKQPCADEEKLALTFEAWKYTAASEIWGYPIAGEFNLYSGGGYIANLDVNRLISVESLKELFNSRWLDRHTRAVFFEFTLYNVNENIFIYVTLLTEFPETGGAVTFKNIFPFRPSQHEGASASYIIFCELAFVCYVIGYSISIIASFAKQKFKYFTQFWNIVDLVMVSLAIISIALYAIRTIFTMDALKKYRDNDRLFVNFYHIALWDGTFILFLGCLVAIATVRLIKALGYWNLTAKVYNVLWRSASVLPGLTFYVITMLFSFSFAGILLFGRLSFGYKSFLDCMETLFTAVIGSPYFRHTNAEIGDHWITIMYFCFFVVLITLTMQNLFLAILLDVMTMTENDPKETELDVELVSYVWQSFMGVFTGRQAGLKRKADNMTALQIHELKENQTQDHGRDNDGYYRDAADDLYGTDDGTEEIPYIISRSNSMNSHISNNLQQKENVDL